MVILTSHRDTPGARRSTGKTAIGKTAIRLSTWVLFAAWVLGSAAYVRGETQEQQDIKSAHVVVGTDNTGPNGDAFIPIIFSPAAAESIGTLLLEIKFPEKELVFQKIRATDTTAELLNLSASAEKDAQAPGTMVLRVRIESKTGALESGILGHLIFSVPGTVTFGAKFPLPQTAQALSPGPNPKPVALTSVDGLIDVSALPKLFSCFFYMH